MAGLKILTVQDIPRVWELSNAEGWNQTEKDWKFLIENPGNVCLALEQKGKTVATATAMNYEKRVAWIGMVLVDKAFRGKGYSKLLLSELLIRLRSYQTIKLDATPAGQPVYQKFGFRNERVINRMILESLEMDLPEFENENMPTVVQTTDIPEIIKYDAQVFGNWRVNLLEYLIQENSENAWVLSQQGELKGIALGRKGTRFFQVGPLSAESEREAKILLSQMLNKLPHQPVVVDVWEEKMELINWLVNIGFIKQRQFVRMVLGENSPEISEKQFLICGPEFG